MGVDPPPGNVPRSLLLPPPTSVRSVLAVAPRLTRAATPAVAVDGGVTVGVEETAHLRRRARAFLFTRPSLPILARHTLLRLPGP